MPLLNQLLIERVQQQFQIINNFAINIIKGWRSRVRPPEKKYDANGNQSIVTEADKEIEEGAIEILSRVFPDIPILGEETFNGNYQVTQAPYFFVIDPIDGTSQFVRANSEWSVSLCLIKDGTPVVGSIFMPDKNDWFITSSLDGVHGNGRIIYKIPNQKQLIAVSPRQIKNVLVKKIIETFGLAPVTISALTPKICAILRGEVDAAVYFPLKDQLCTIWDYAAATALLTRFGGKITSLTGESLPFQGKGIIHREGWLAANDDKLHNELLAMYKSIKYGEH